MGHLHNIQDAICSPPVNKLISRFTQATLCPSLLSMVNIFPPLCQVNHSTTATMLSKYPSSSQQQYASTTSNHKYTSSDPDNMIMLKSIHFTITPVNEADDAVSEEYYPAKQSEENNDVLDGIAFMPSLDMKSLQSSDVRDEQSVDKGATLDREHSRKDGMSADKEGGTDEIDVEVAGVNGRDRDVYRCKHCKETFKWATKLQVHLLGHPVGGKVTDISEKDTRRGRLHGATDNSKRFDEKEIHDKLKEFGTNWHNTNV